jgi:hypothetical protein
LAGAGWGSLNEHCLRCLNEHCLRCLQDKLGDLEVILEQWRGEEGQLLQEVRAKYLVTNTNTGDTNTVTGGGGGVVTPSRSSLSASLLQRRADTASKEEADKQAHMYALRVQCLQRRRTALGQAHAVRSARSRREREKRSQEEQASGVWTVEGVQAKIVAIYT